VFDVVGVFDESFDACEDVEFNHRVDRAGLSCFFTPAVAVRYQPRGSLRGLFRQMVRYGRGRCRLLRKHPDTFSLASFVPALFVMGLLAGGVLSWFSMWIALAYLSVIGLYLLIVCLTSLALAVQCSPAMLLWLPLVFVTIHLGAGTGMVWEWLGGSPPPLRGRAKTEGMMRSACPPPGENAAARQQEASVSN
jgi:succinoglycan biosynthesis protein ExoA